MANSAEQQAAGEHGSAWHHKRARKFATGCGRMRMPAASIERWLAASDAAWRYMPLHLASCLGQIVVVSLFIWGAMSLAHSLQIAIQAAAAALVVMQLAWTVVVISNGPDLTQRYPIGVAAYMLVYFVLHFFLYTIPCFRTHYHMPFQSRAVHLVLVTAGMLPTYVGCMSAVFPWDRCARKVPVWSFLWIAVLRTIESVDAKADIMYASLLYEQVRYYVWQSCWLLTIIPVLQCCQCRICKQCDMSGCRNRRACATRSL